MAASFWLFLAPLLTGASVGLVVAFLLEEENPWRSVGLLAGAVVALLLRMRLMLLMVILQNKLINN